MHGNSSAKPMKPPGSICGFRALCPKLRRHSEYLAMALSPDHAGRPPWYRETKFQGYVTVVEYYLDDISPRNDYRETIIRYMAIFTCRAMQSIAVHETFNRKGGRSCKGGVRRDRFRVRRSLSARNKLIHATWRIGRWAPFEEFSEIGVEKYRVGADGFSKRTDLPKNFNELTECGNRCQRLHSKLGRFLQFFHYQPGDIEKVFEYSKAAEKWQKWKFVPPTSIVARPTDPAESRSEFNSAIFAFTAFKSLSSVKYATCPVSFIEGVTSISGFQMYRFSISLTP